MNPLPPGDKEADAMTHRDHRMDNMRCLLIFLVVLGHFLAWVPGSQTLYRIIYLFHMPAFLFITGYFSRFRPRKLLLDLLYPYLLFQLLYLLFDTLVLKDAPLDHMVVQFTTPYWLLWYLLATIFYRLTVPLIDRVPHRCRPLALVGAVVLSLAAGYVRELGYFLSLARFFSFCPYFLAGHYAAQSPGFLRWMDRPLKQKWPPALLGCSIAAVSCLHEHQFTLSMLYGSVGYAKAGFGPGLRLAQLVFAWGWILALLVLIPNRPIPAVTRLGQNTLPIFLLHGFAVRLIGHSHLFQFPLWANFLLAFALSLVLVALLGAPVTRSPFQLLFTGKWLDPFFLPQRRHKRQL